MRLIRILVAAAIILGVPVLFASSASGTISGPCTASGTINGATYNATQTFVVIPRKGDVHWKGAINTGSGTRPVEGKVYLKPGTVTTVAIDKKTFKGTTTRITITGVRIKTDQCAGQSFIRSYATLTSSTDNTDDVITYLGVTKAV